MERPRQGFIYASSPSWLTVLNIVMNKATMRQVNQVCLLMSYKDAQGLGMVRRMVCCSKPCLQFWVVHLCISQVPCQKAMLLILCSMLQNTCMKTSKDSIVVLPLGHSKICCSFVLCLFLLFFFWSRPEVSHPGN